MCSVLIWTSNVVKCNYFYISVTYFETIFQSRTIAVTGRTRLWDVQIHVQAFIHRRGYKTSKVRSVANRNNTGKTKSNPRANVGRRSANNIQQGKAER